MADSASHEVLPEARNSPTANNGTGGILYHPDCWWTFNLNCQHFSPGSNTNVPGRLYGASIIQPWINEVDPNTVDLIWNVSTWNPYQVSLMRTRIQED